MKLKDTGSIELKTGLAEMLKGGVIMDVINAEQAKIAEDAGAVAVMALERVPADIRATGGRGADVSSRTCFPDQRNGQYSGHGQMPDRPFCRSSDP